MIEVRRYGHNDAEVWNAFVQKARNATFLFDRRYMDYHQDRFVDHSLLIFQKQRLFALLPANAVGNTLYSHQGLTYGGLITDFKATTANVCAAFEAINRYCQEQGFEQVVYKALPWIYHDYPSEEALYALTNVCHAQLFRRAVGTAMPLSPRPLKRDEVLLTESRKSGLRKAQRAGVRVEQSCDIPTFWRILDDNLQQNHQTHPVHTVDELQLLAERFPQNILLYMAYEDDEPVGGVLLYLTRHVVHTQYISATSEGKKVGAVDMLLYHIIHHLNGGFRFFDFGTSVKGEQCELNEPLIFQKEGFGGRAVCYDTYIWHI